MKVWTLALGFFIAGVMATSQGCKHMGPENFFDMTDDFTHNGLRLRDPPFASDEAETLLDCQEICAAECACNFLTWAEATGQCSLFHAGNPLVATYDVLTGVVVQRKRSIAARQYQTPEASFKKYRAMKRVRDPPRLGGVPWKTGRFSSE